MSTNYASEVANRILLDGGQIGPAIAAAIDAAMQRERDCWLEAVRDFKHSAESVRPKEPREDGDENDFIDHAIHSANSIVGRAEMIRRLKP